MLDDRLAICLQVLTVGTGRPRWISGIGGSSFSIFGGGRGVMLSLAATRL